jgi:polyisoprenoid-binding protein YceI
MKKLLITLLVFSFLSCNSDHKKAQNNDQLNKKEVSSQLWKLDPDQAQIKWTAYKTTAKLPVKGEFKQFDIEGVKPASTMEETLENAQIKINIFSIFTNEEQRDKRLIQSFFEKMPSTQFISVKVNKIDKNLLYATIKMNGVSKEIPFSIKKDEERGILILKSHINLIKDFDAEKPLSILNKACYDLHMGKDGISKTWPDVELEAFLKFSK